MHRLALLAFLSLACAKPSARPADVSASIDGRWVAETTPMAYHLFGDSAEIVVYPHQEAPLVTWRVRGDSVLVSDGTGISSHRFYIRADSLFIDWNPGPRPTRMTRMRTGAGPGLVGTWRARTQRDVMVVTFRSDSVLIGELGVDPFPLRRGDTLSTRMGSGFLRQVLRRSGSSLHVTTPSNTGEPELRLVRRPWGCFGVAKLDGAARECR